MIRLVILRTLCFFCSLHQYLSDDTIHLNFNSNDILSFPTFDGIGAISGGGATSKLLVSYKEPYSSQIYDYLFKPQFAASLHMLKVEIGGDAQSTEGTEASHSHYGTDLNCFRGYEWHLIKAAKQRNPNILLYGLPWAFPGWVGDFKPSPYQNVTKLASYIVNWLKCARDQHNSFVDFIGIWNEKAYDIGYIKILRKSLDANGFAKTRIIASDGDWNIANDVKKDTELSNAIYALGAHYPGTTSEPTRGANKALWSSEDYSTMNNESGPLCWARILNQNYVNGNMTSTISWNLIAAYYDDLPYPRCGLMTAIEPWSGNYIVPPTIWVTAHTTQFSQPGWKYAPIGAGARHLSNGGSFVTIIDPTFNNLTMVFESMTRNKSPCIRPYLPPYNVQDQTVTVSLESNSLRKFKKFYLWRSKLTSKSEADIFKFENEIEPDSKGQFSFSLPVDQVVTISTVSSAKKGTYPNPPASAQFPGQYADDFEKYALAAEPDLLSPQVGSFEVNSTGYNKFLQQTVIDTPIQWCFSKQINRNPIALVGNFNKSDIFLNVSIMVPSIRPAEAVFIGGRINNAGCTMFLAGGVFYWINFNTSQAIITTDMDASAVKFSKSVSVTRDKWYQVAMELQEQMGKFYLNGQLVGTLNNLYNIGPIHGFAGLGTKGFGFANYDNFTLSTK